MSKRQASSSPLSRLRLIGMVHLPPLPGVPGNKQPMAAIVERAVSEASLLQRHGFEAVIIENFGDAPFPVDNSPPETAAAMAIVLDHVTRAIKIPVGVNVLRNDWSTALAVAATAGARFIRVNILSGAYATDQGIITGQAHALARRRAQLGGKIAVMADVHVKHAVPINQPDIALAAEETAYRGGADGLIVSGQATGSPADLDHVQRVVEAVPDRPVWIGSGVTADNVQDYLAIASGVIVGTSLKKGGQTTATLDESRVKTFIRSARSR